jgi:putative sterol carrier protein
MDEDRKFDLDKMVAAARRGAARAPAQLADGISRWVDQAPDDRLERLMKSPARRMILEGVFWKMPQQLDGRRAEGVDASVLWRIGGRPDGATDDFRLVIADGSARTVRGASDEPPPPVLTVTLDGVYLLKLASGGLDPIRGYLTGKIVLAGDIMFAAKLGGMFHVPTPRAA